MQLIKHIWFQKSRASLPFASNFATFRISMHELGYQKGRIIKHKRNIIIVIRNIFQLNLQQKPNKYNFAILVMSCL